MAEDEISVFYLDSPMGLLKLEGDSNGVSSIDFAASDKKAGLIDEIPTDLSNAVLQLTEYFHRKRTSFNIPLNAKGTDFQRAVWDGLQTIPFGKTISYKELAVHIGRPTSTRAAANAIGKNPILIIVPCHRVIGSDGTLTGFSSGLHHKKWLLNHEDAPCMKKVSNQ
mmetsp:Transcript_4029/g.5002  ORF Transcript_4029/g.5002 Transcript_4029/m.5002 type:complete len:167 (-) Transcript_4029:811-1311(-)